MKEKNRNGEKLDGEVIGNGFSERQRWVLIISILGYERTTNILSIELPRRAGSNWAAEFCEEVNPSHFKILLS